MSHHKRTKKDVAEAYRRGFEAGFNVRPNPVAMILRSVWRKHEQKKLRREWKKHFNEITDRELLYGEGKGSVPIGILNRVWEDEDGLHAEGFLKEPDEKPNL